MRPTCQPFARRGLRYGLLITLACFGWMACQDPSNVGLSLLDEDSNPRRVTLPNLGTTFGEIPELTGNRVPVLTGTVDDPVLGEITTQAYINFQSTRPVALNDTTTLRSGSVVLRPTYLYGDTLATVTMALRAIPTAWTADSVRADTTINSGDEITQFSFQATDTLVTVPLPEAWLTENRTLLYAQDVDFRAQFFGFHVELVSEGTIVGFNNTGSSLRVEASTVTTDFPIDRVATTIQHTPNPNLPANRALLLDGTGDTFDFSFNFGADSVREAAINGATLRIQVDTNLMQHANPNFVRPLPGLSLHLTDGEGTRGLIETQVADENGVYTFSSSVFTTVVQSSFLNNDETVRFSLSIPSVPNSINGAVIHNEATPENGIGLILTLINTH